MSEPLLYTERDITKNFIKMISSDQYKNASASQQQEQLFNFTDQISVKSSGNTTILYSGRIDGQSTNDLVEKIITEEKNIRAINRTPAAFFLSSEIFQTAYVKTEGIAFDDYDAKKGNISVKTHKKITQLKNKLFHGETGAWARISQRFVAETEGHVKILTSPAANPKGGFALTELPELKKNTQVVTVNGHTKAQFNKMNLQEILQDAYQKRHSIQEQPSPTKIDKKAAFKTAYQALKSTKNIINHQQQSSQLSGHQNLKQQSTKIKTLDINSKRINYDFYE